MHEDGGTIRTTTKQRVQRTITNRQNGYYDCSAARGIRQGKSLLVTSDRVKFPIKCYRVLFLKQPEFLLLGILFPLGLHPERCLVYPKQLHKLNITQVLLLVRRIHAGGKHSLESLVWDRTNGRWIEVRVTGCRGGTGSFHLLRSQHGWCYGDGKFRRFSTRQGRSSLCSRKRWPSFGIRSLFYTHVYVYIF